MHASIEEKTRGDIIHILPDLIARALSSYNEYARQSVDINSKEFAEYHKSCKVAIAHIELLIKLSKWADRKDGVNSDPILSGMLAKAGEELAAYRRNRGEEEDSE